MTADLGARKNSPQKKKENIKKTTFCEQSGYCKKIQKKEQQKKQRCLKKNKKTVKQLETKKNIQRYTWQVFKRKKRVVLCKKAKKLDSIGNQKEKTKNKIKGPKKRKTKKKTRNVEIKNGLKRGNKKKINLKNSIKNCKIERKKETNSYVAIKDFKRYRIYYVPIKTRKNRIYWIENKEQERVFMSKQKKKAKNKSSNRIKKTELKLFKERKKHA